MDQITATTSPHKIPPAITELEGIPPRINPARAKKPKASTFIRKDAYIARCVNLENALREKDREIERLQTETEENKTDGSLCVFGMGAAAIAGAIIGTLLTIIYFKMRG